MSTTETPTVIDPEAPEGGKEPRAEALPAPIAVAGLPNPRDLQASLRAQIDRYVTDQRTARGAVHVKEDAFPLLRSLAGAADYFGDYGRVCRTIERHLRGHVEDETVEAIGEDSTRRAVPSWNGEGIPSGNLVVPEGDGDWHITREWDSDVEADWHSIAGAQARLTASHVLGGTAGEAVPDVGDYVAAGVPQDQMDELVYGVAILVAEDIVDRLDALRTKAGKPSVRALEGWGKELARKGLDELSSIVAGAWKRRSLYRGIKVERS